ncbi:MULTISPECIES: hypothetical protein [Myxococcus]|uniref:hypothetical protein n=1 Tax=Myxococcus TaxID=32 RepID=UPI0013D1265A|nr:MULTISPECIES: hypothetical protein [Myxococcus]NVJ26864.1 hypothetical protein [Myxococcus sp. AM011]
MVMELERRGRIRRCAGQAHSIELLLAPELLPILRLSGAILGTLDTGTPIALADLELYPLTPFSDQIEELEGETPSATDIEKWVAKHFKANP